MQDVLTRIRRTFGDESGVQIQDQDVIRWINDAQEKIVLENEGLMETTSTTDIFQNQADYDFPPDLSVLVGLRYKNHKIKNLTFPEFNEYVDDSTNYGAGVPEFFTIWDNKILLFPKPNEDFAAGLTIYYIRHPTPVANLADELAVPLQYHNAIVKFCLKEAYELDEDENKAQIAKADFDSDVMKLNDRNKWASQEYYPTITTLPQDESWGGFY